MECYTPQPETREKTVHVVLWVILLFLVAWPLAWLVAPIWIVLLPFEAVFYPIRDLNAFLEKLITWPRMLGDAIIESREAFPSPIEYAPAP